MPPLWHHPLREQTGKLRLDANPVALPPEAEQQRILAKVNELTTLCDAVEASLTTARARLLGATLAEALAPAEARALEPA